MDRVLILSFQPQSGKSTVALQLTDAYRQQGRSVVLMDYTADQVARVALDERSAADCVGVRGVAAGKEVHMLSKVWAEEVDDFETVIVDTACRLEPARLDYLLRQINSVLLVVDVSQIHLGEFEQQFSELIKRIRMVRSRLVVIATHCADQGLLKVVQLRQKLDQFQIPLVMKLEQMATPSQIESLAQMLLSEEMRVDSVSGNRLGRALHTATVRAGSMVGAVETLSEIAEEVKQSLGSECADEEIESLAHPSVAMESLQEKNRLLAEENERLRRS
ncbi:MAG: hypothetical protein HN382_10415 [Gammaproteobacteria bacterium]|nr:hypothetical protein [Gammaproteobacteria bacterium]MBT4607637.1 hypothetical protein [Thiotrichales bacterium]MBT3471790.1 hypothetical protein [Gammaproteobacteria bacterium]MBT3968148.1 hypothetical protein [Gammaproteobacteria bacterium]MBT4081986.1 hypothetical protein [Gammaproteobacteria bacterium]